MLSREFYSGTEIEIDGFSFHLRILFSSDMFRPRMGVAAEIFNTRFTL